MLFFPCAHASHPLWQQAVRQVVVQLRAHIDMQPLPQAPALGLVYISEPYTPHASAILALLAESFPDVRQWSGCATSAVLGGDMDYGHASAVAVMLPCLAPGDFQVFTAMAPLSQTSGSFVPRLRLVHGDADMPSLALQLQTLAAHSGRSGHGGLRGGLAHLPGGQLQMVLGGGAVGGMPSTIGSGGVQRGGLSGVGFSRNVDVLCRSVQGCRPISQTALVTAVQGQQVLALDGKPALDHLLESLDLRSALTGPEPDTEGVWCKVRQTLVALSPEGATWDSSCVGADAHVHPMLGLDLESRGLLLDHMPEVGQCLTFCQRDEEAARADLRRACAEIQEILMPDPTHNHPVGPQAQQPAGTPRPMGPALGIAGVLYVRSQHRQTPARLPQADPELTLIRHALGPVPLLGFTSAAEVAGSGLQHLSGQLVVFTQPLTGLA